MITDEEFRRITVHMKQRYGIDLSQKKVIVNGRLENYIRRKGWSNFNDFMNAVENDKSGNEEKMLVNFLTTNHTYFMREFEHFEFFKQTVLPWLKKREEKSKDVRIWCGAASTGEEPYMIAMVLSDFFSLEKGDWDTRILATDISTKVLQQAMTGIYSVDQIEKMPEPWRRHYFKALPGGMYRVQDELKKEIIFRQFNLMDPFPFKRKMHVIFLRNVMIYFDEPTKQEVLRKVYDSLVPGGYLFIGATETIDRSATPFQFVRSSVFRKREGR